MKKGRIVISILAVMLGIGLVGATQKADASCSYASWSTWAAYTNGQTGYATCTIVRSGTTYYGMTYMDNCSDWAGCLRARVDGCPISGNICQFVNEGVKMQASYVNWQTGATGSVTTSTIKYSTACNNPMVSYSLTWPTYFYQVRCALGTCS